MSNCEETKIYCHSIFKDGSSETTIDRFTAALVRMINLVEKAKSEATDLPEEK